MIKLLRTKWEYNDCLVLLRKDAKGAEHFQALEIAQKVKSYAYNSFLSCVANNSECFSQLHSSDLWLSKLTYFLELAERLLN